jgi:hypothetical protein
MKRWHYALLCLVFLSLGATLILPIFDKRSLLDRILNQSSKQLEPLASQDVEAYIWIPSTGYGSMPRWEINRSYAKEFLKDNMKWSLQASNDNSTWQNANQLLDINLNWNETDVSYKVTLTLNTTNAPRALYYRFDLACNKSLKQYLERDGWEWTLTVPANNTKDYTLVFNWSDIRGLVDTGKVWFDRGVKDNFFWFRIQSVNKVPVGTVFVVDPTYGLIVDNGVQSWEYNTLTATYPDMLRLGTSEYYLISYVDKDSDVRVNTTRIWDSNGTIQQSTVDVLEIDADSWASTKLCHVSGDIYAIAYGGTVVNSGFMDTFYAWSSNGSIGSAVIDTINTRVTSTITTTPDILKFTDNIFVVAGTDRWSLGSEDGWMGTYWINTVTGLINDSILDSQEFDTKDALNPKMCKVDSNTIAIAYTTTGTDGNLSTWNISSVGIITNTYSDFWEFDTLKGGTPTIAKVTGNIFMIAYENTNADIYVNTTTIANTGTITKSWADALLIDATNGDYPTFFNVSYNTTSKKWIKGISFSGEGSDGYISTFDVDAAGTITSEIDTLEIFAADTIGWYMPNAYVAKDYYAVVAQDGSTDGWIKTYLINTNWANATFTNPSPANNSIDQALTPQCSITVNDSNGDTMNIYFAENSTGSWVIRQANNSVTNGTYKWTFAQATNNNQKYYWKVFANDSCHNGSNWFCFTTIAAGGNTPPIFSEETPTNNSISIAIDIGLLSILINDTEGDTFGYEWGCSDGSSNSAAGNTNGTKNLMLNPADLEYNTLYTWWVNATDEHGDWTNATYYFTTIAQQRQSTNIFDYYFLCGNESERVSTNVFDYYFLCGNESIRTATQVFDYYFYCGNETSPRNVVNAFDYYFVCGNESVRTPTQVFDYWFLCGNESVRTSTNIFDYYFVCGNESVRTQTEVFDYYFYCGNETIPRNATNAFDYYFYCGNESERVSTNVFDYYFYCGNETPRISTNVFDYYFLCGNESTRNTINIFDFYFYCGNESIARNATNIFDYYFVCGNESSRISTNAFDYYFYCGNESIPLNITAATPYNLNLLVINPNPGNGTHNTNYIKKNSSGLTTSIDVFYKNFTSPPTSSPGYDSLTVDGTPPANVPCLYNSSTIYANVWANTTGTISTADLFVGQYLSVADYVTYRGFLMFDTSAIPDDAIIDSANVSLVILTFASLTDFNVTLQEMKSPVPHDPLIPTDYNKNAFAGDFGHENTTGYNDDDYFNITLNAGGITYIDKTGDTIFGIRSDQDIVASAPINSEIIGFYAYSFVPFYPKLIISYHTPNPNWKHLVNLTWYSNSSGPWIQYYKSYVNHNGTVTVFNANFSGIDTYYWHLQWESNHTNNGSSQIFEFETVSDGVGNIIIASDSKFIIGMVIGCMLFFVFAMIMWRRKND